MTTQSHGTPAPLIFRNTTFTIIDRNGEIWLKASELARALELSREDQVNQIYKRHADEFTNSMTQTINLMVSGEINGLRNVTTRIFSLRGSHLIAMFARTPLAKAFRVWVLDILDRHIKTPAPSPSTNQLELFKQLVHVLEQQEHRIHALEQRPTTQTCPAGFPILG